MKSLNLPLLTIGEEIALSRRVHGSDPADAIAARNELVLANLRLAGKAAYFAHRRWGGDKDEYFAEACVALTDAAQGFREEHGKRFAAYAMTVMMNNLQEFHRRAATISVAKRVFRQLYDEEAIARMRTKEPRSKTERSQASRERFDGMLRDAHRARGVASIAALDQRGHSNEPIDPSLSPVQALIRAETNAHVMDALGHLPPLHAYVVAHFYGLCDLPQRSASDLARELGLSRERARQIHVEALDLIGRRFGAPAQKISWSTRVRSRRACA